MHNNDPTQTDTETLIKAMRHLAENIYSEDGVANAAIAEAADRLRELDMLNKTITMALSQSRDRGLLLELDNRRLHMVIEDLQCRD